MKWCVEKITDPRPSPKYQFQEDGKTPLTEEDVDVLEEKMRAFLSAAENELLNRE